jgi:hypothetical protein
MAPAQGQLAASIVARSAQRVAASSHSEHISLESAPEEHSRSVEVKKSRKVLDKFELKSGIRGMSTELKLLEDYWLSVHSIRPRTEPRKYLVDLRFANPKPNRVREISWGWLGAGIALLLTSVGAGWLSAFAVAAGGLLASFAALFIAYLRTIESLTFTSVHGGAILVSITGGLGSCRSAKHFFVTLIKHISVAKTKSTQQKQQYLREEMREHSRLKDLGVLTDEEYEASKQRIFASY